MILGFITPMVNGIATASDSYMCTATASPSTGSAAPNIRRTERQPNIRWIRNNNTPRQYTTSAAIGQTGSPDTSGAPGAGVRENSTGTSTAGNGFARIVAASSMPAGICTEIPTAG